MFLEQRLSAMDELAAILSPRKHLAMSGDISGCHNRGGTITYLVVEARDVAK